MKLLVWAIADTKSAPGVYRKMEGMAAGAKRLGHDAESIFIKPGKKMSYFSSLSKEVSKSRDVYIFRAVLGVLPLLLVFGAIFRLLGRKVIFDIPTPYSANFRYEINNGSYFSKVKLILFTYLLVPWAYLIPNLTISYARETGYLANFQSSSDLIIGNGIDVDVVTKRKSRPERSEPLKLIGVATIAEWHGWDYVIEAIAEVKKLGRIVEFTIIGEGPDRVGLEQLVDKLELNDSIKFLGWCDPSTINQWYEKHHLAVGSFGWSRVGVEIASPLKYREYCASGMPFVYSTVDPDFTRKDAPCYYLESHKDLVNFIYSFDLNSIPDDDSCVEFALANLEFNTKIKQVFEFLDV